MSEQNTGGPAFPIQGFNGIMQCVKADGMSLRDYFAAFALQGLSVLYARTSIGMKDIETMQLITASTECKEDCEFTVASMCYRLADAMLIAREQ